MSINNDKSDLEKLLMGVTGQEKKAKPPVNVDTEKDVVEQKPIFTYDYDNEMRKLKKQARKTIRALVSHILTDELLEEDYIKDKIEQDIITLSELYWNRKSNEIMKLSIMDSVSKGNTQPRMYEVYSNLNDSISENNKQILATENNIRKTYTDLKMEVQTKKAESMPTKPENKQITQETFTTTGTKQMLEHIKERQKASEALKALSQTANVIEDVTFEQTN